MDSDQPEVVVKLAAPVVWEPSEKTVDSDHLEVVVELPVAVVWEPSEETVDSDQVEVVVELTVLSLEAELGLQVVVVSPGIKYVVDS